MIRVSGPDPGVLRRPMRHHGEQYRPLIIAITFALLYESKMARDEDQHVLHQSRNGPGSFGLYLSDGRQYHFRAAGGPAIRVVDAFRNGRLVAILKTEPQCRAFIRKLSKSIPSAKKWAA